MSLKTVWTVVSLAVCASGAIAGDGVWNYESEVQPDGRNPDEPADWSDPANWIGETVPSGKDATAYLVDKAQTSSMADTLRYIRVPDEGVALGGISSRRGVRLFVTGGPIALVDNATGMGYSQPSLRDEVANATYCDAVFFNEMTLGDNIYINRCTLAGTVRPSTPSSYLILADSFRAVPYRQALSDSETIVDPSYNGRFRVGSCFIGYYAPSGADAATGFWQVTEGSRMLTRVGVAHELAAGQRVTGVGIPPGAFVSRIYADSLIEISAPATESSVDETGTELSFAAFSPIVRQNIAALYLQGSNCVTFSPMKLRPQDDVVYFVDALSNTASQYYEVALDFHAEHYNVLPGHKVYPAQVVFKKTSTDARPLRLVNADVAFDDGTSATSTCARVTIGKQEGSYSMVQPTGSVSVAVGPGKVTRWLSLEEFDGALTKRGAGELSITPTCPELGTLVVNEGRVSLSGDAAARTLASLHLAEGTALTLAEGQTLTVASSTFVPGAAIHVAAGAQLNLTLAPGATFDGVSKTGEGRLSLHYGTDIRPLDSGAPLESGAQFDPGVKGTPAFWVSADSLAAATPAGLLEQVDDKLEVLRWNDCRTVAEGGTMFATNRVNRPYLVTSGTYPYVKFPTGSNTKETNYGLIWDRPLKNIRAVFTVIDVADGFGSILGASSRLTNLDFLRGSRGLTANIIYDNGAGGYGTAAIANPRTACYVNGEELPTYATTPSSLGITTGIAVIEIEPTDDCQADAFASCNESGSWARRWDLVGGERLLECLVYTNTLSYVDRYNIHAYLMRKYGKVLPSRKNNEVFRNDKRTRVDDFNPSRGIFGCVEVDAGCTATLPSVSSGASLEKTGSGTLYVSDAGDAGALRVQAGTLVVRSPDITDAQIPSDAAVRFDASDLTSLTYSWDPSRGLNTVTRWKDLVSGMTATLKQGSHTNLPFVLENALNGRPVVDFGPALANIGYSQTDPNPCLVFTPQYNLKTVFSVIGSERGGCTLLGGSSGRQDGYSVRQSNKSTLGIWRNVQGHPGDLTLPIVETDGSSINAEFTYLNVLHVRQNGVLVDQTKSYFSGGYDLFTLNANTTNLESSVLGAIHYSNSGGGMQLAETILYKRNLDPKEIEDVEAYLDEKWFDRRKAGYRLASAASVEIAAGATLRVAGGAPLTVKSLAGAGTVEGSVRVAADSVLTVTANGSGEVEPIVVSGSVDLSAGGTIVLVGATERLGTGTYEILRAGSPLVLGAWTVDASAVPGQRVCGLKTVGNSLYLEIKKQGFLLLVR